MTVTKEEFSRAYHLVAAERMPDLSGIPEHVFSAGFEKRMDRLIKKEAAHPWMSSHVAVRNLLIAALIAILLLALATSAFAIANKKKKTFEVKHYSTYSSIVFEKTTRTAIEHVYKITKLPEGYILIQQDYDENESNYVVYTNPEKEGCWELNFEQSIPNGINGPIVDNERSELTTFEMDGHTFFYSHHSMLDMLAWEMDGYSFWITYYMHEDDKEKALNTMIELYKSIQ